MCVQLHPLSITLVSEHPYRAEGGRDRGDPALPASPSPFSAHCRTPISSPAPPSVPTSVSQLI